MLYHLHTGWKVEEGFNIANEDSEVTRHGDRTAIYVTYKFERLAAS